MLLRSGLRCEAFSPVLRKLAIPSLLLGPETASEKLWRWVDVTGFLTRFHSRRAMILNRDPNHRIVYTLTSEFERKAEEVMWLGTLFLLPFCFWYWWGQITHLAHKPPTPLILHGPNVDPLEGSYPMFAGRWQQCTQCRWLEPECKKECFDQIRAEGGEIWGLSRPRILSIGTH